MELQGIDVSHYQGKIDWKKVAASGIKFAIMKCQYEAQSHRMDETFEYNYSEAGKVDIARGVYIYIAKASIANPELDAQSLLKHLNGRKLEYGIWLDLEDKSLDVMGKAYIKDLAYKYADIFMKAGYYVGIYCNRDWYIRLIHDDLKQSFDFWIARYPKNDRGIYNEHSTLKPPTNTAVAWQYSSKGHVPGIIGKVDLDVDYDGILNLVFDNVRNPYTLSLNELREGNKGESVKCLQWALNRFSANLVVDGIFGPKTKLAVLLFQKDHGLSLTGIADSKTLEALNV